MAYETHFGSKYNEVFRVKVFMNFKRMEKEQVKCQTKKIGRRIATSITKKLISKRKLQQEIGRQISQETHSNAASPLAPDEPTNEEFQRRTFRGRKE